MSEPLPKLLSIWRIAMASAALLSAHAFHPVSQSTDQLGPMDGGLTWIRAHAALLGGRALAPHALQAAQRAA